MSREYHKLKTLPRFYDDVLSGRKKFEIRKNDRDFQCGDVLVLRRYDGEKYTGECLYVEVTYICPLEPMLPGYVGMGILPIREGWTK